MARCEGTTKSGSRCKRSAAEDSAFCATHTDQGARDSEGSAPPEAERVGSERASRRDKHPLADAALIGIVALGMLVLRRLIRWH